MSHQAMATTTTTTAAAAAAAQSTESVSVWPDADVSQ